MKKKNNLKNTIDNFLIKKNGKIVLKNIEKKNLITDGILNSLDVFSLASLIEKKIKKKVNISDKKIFDKFSRYKDLIEF